MTAATETAARVVSAYAHARVGLLGNPSDIYSGKTLGFAVQELRVGVKLESTETISLPNDLMKAGWTAFQPSLMKFHIDPASRPFTLTFQSDIPLQSGLSGSSALLIAALRCWGRWFGLPMTPSVIAEIAWKAENDVLRIRAGPQDRLVQAHGGLIFMDCSDAFAERSVTRLDASLLPPLLIAWHGTPGTASGDVHAPVYDRWKGGDETITSTMHALADNAESGRVALLAGKYSDFAACVDRNLALRASLFPLADADAELVAVGKRLGAACKFPGSGGAVLFACADDSMRDAVEAACRATSGVSVLRPTVAPPTPRLRAVFLAAGFATRLYPLTLHTAKPLLQVGGEPVLSRVVRAVEGAGGVEDGVVVCNGRFATDFDSWADTATTHMPIRIVNDGAQDNDSRLGAIGDLQLALRRAAKYDAGHRPDGYIVMACDNIFTFDIGVLVDKFAATGGAAQLVVRQVPEPVPPSKYSEVILDGDKVRRFREKPAAPESNLSAIAVYILPAHTPALVDEYLAGGGNPDAPGHFIAWLSSRVTLHATPLTGEWLDIGSADDLAAANAASQSAVPAS